MKDVTYGAELELADVDTSLNLPKGNLWCYKDGSICNSNGTANDPKKKFNRFGGEIQTRACLSPEELVKEVKKIYQVLNVNENCFNFTTNLHVHIRIPKLLNNLDLLKKFLKYIVKNDKNIYKIIEPISKPIKMEYLTEKSYIGAMKRFKRRKRSHQYNYEASKVPNMLIAQTMEEFFNGAVVRRKSDNKPLWHLFVRPGINLIQILDTETIEFRCFTMSQDLTKMYNAFKWCELFVKAVLKDLNVEEILNKGLKFQRFHPYKYELDWIFQMTNVYHNTRKIVKNNYIWLVENNHIKQEELGVDYDFIFMHR